jgi:hypothetical protein
MRYLLILVVAVAMLIGCGAEQKAVTKQPTETSKPAKSIDLPNNLQSSTLGLIKNRQLVRVGDTAEQALEAFEKPDKARALSEAPPEWPKDIRATGWEADDRGLGILISNEKIVGMLYSEYETTPERIAEIKGDYVSTFGSPQADSESTNVHYSFWEDDENRLVFCSTKNHKGKLVVTVGCGLKQIMDKLGLSMSEAKKESEAAERILADFSAKSQ